MRVTRGGEVLDELGVRRILVVEDESQVLQALGRVIRSWGCDVLLAGDCSSAIATLRDEPVELVIADFCLPDGTGVDVTREALRSRHVKWVVGMSGVASREHVAALIRTGAADCLDKPCGQRALLECLTRLPRRASSVERSDTMVDQGSASGLTAACRELRRHHFEEALRSSRYNISQAARLLGLTRQAVQYAIRAYGIEMPPAKSPRR